MTYWCFSYNHDCTMYIFEKNFSLYFVFLCFYIRISRISCVSRTGEFSCSQLILVAKACPALAA